LPAVILLVQGAMIAWTAYELYDNATTAYELVTAYANGELTDEQFEDALIDAGLNAVIDVSVGKLKILEKSYELARKAGLTDKADDIVRQIANHKNGGGNLSGSKPTYKIGDSDGGPGSWTLSNENMTDVQRAYQKKVTGAPEGTTYNVDDPNVPSGRTSFDGYNPATNALIDAKCWTCWPNNSLDFSNQSVVDQAFRQQRVALETGRTVEWHVPDQSAAIRIQNAFATAPNEMRIDPSIVRIVVTPK
ncbi:Tox-REase-5 domain-containing protein, partial [Thalassospira xiamenensis]|uniref:Tox-REase-5 domain-containing protein n=2 Tax=Thalassospira xiamenensis TaxID=220697 RepID=UPI000AED26E7